MPPIRRPRRPASSAVARPGLELTRRFLFELFAPHQQLGAAWGDDDPAFLIVEQSYGRFWIALYARPGGNGLWDLRVVALPPPPSAMAVLRFSRRSFRAHFDDTGTAIVRDVPATLLTAADGPPLKVNITRRGS